jgi:tRNA-dihydrouridine synthase
MGFWEKLPKPFFALAPMADVTDAAFRQIVAKASRHGEPGGGPDVFWTEFVSADGLMQGGREVLQRDLSFTKGEHPIVAQIFGSNPKNIEGAAKLCADLGFDGVDINMGCPDKSIEKQGAGACMIKSPDIAVTVIRAAKRGAPNLPISVKTRVGYNKVELDTWIPVLLKENIAALTIHARTRKEMSKVPARWEFVKEVVRMRNTLGVPTKIIGNGDVMDLLDGEKKARETGCDGIMIGRAIFGNPWLFDRNRKILQKGSWNLPWYARFLPTRFAKKFNGGDARYTISAVSIGERLTMLVAQATLFESLLGDIKSFSIMKKHVKAYIHGFPGSKELRMKIMDEAVDAQSLRNIIEEYGKKS